MLKTAIAGSIPIIAVRTRDVLNAPDIVHELTGKHTLPFTASKTAIDKNRVYLFVTTGKKDPPPWEELYERLVKQSSTLLVINPSSVDPCMFDAGELPVPKSLVRKWLMQVVDNEAKAEELLRTLGGVTLKEVAELTQLTMARDKSLTAHGLMITRKTFFAGQPGLSLVDTTLPYYVPIDELAAWSALEKPFFLFSNDRRLITRGLLMDGPAGVGKTSGAKWLADQWGVPLYRVDIGGTKDKWQGNSEANNLANLARLDREEPALVLFDEIEKIFGSDHNDGGTTQTMLSQLLWWLADHRSRVLSIMTTNKAKVLPTELYREGRINKVIYLHGLEPTEAAKFAEAVFDTFGKDPDAKQIADIVQEAFTKPIPTNPPSVSQARLTECVYEHIKLTMKPPQ